MYWRKRSRSGILLSLESMKLLEKNEADNLRDLVERHVPEWQARLQDPKTEIPRLAKDRTTATAVALAAREVPVSHRLYFGDAREMELPDASVHLVVTSPPYWTLKRYNEAPGQIGHLADYEQFLDQLDKVWRHCYRALVPGGRLIVVVGDVCLSRRRSKRHFVMPLHASIQERCRAVGFDNLAPIIWYKISNAVYEVENGAAGGFLGKPYEPNAIIKNDIEFILMQRKPGGYRSPSVEARVLSLIPEHLHKEWFRQIWELPGTSCSNHPAPFPLELAERLVRMFSFVGDTVLDPFMGTGTTNTAAGRWGRHSIGYEVDPSYFEIAHVRIGAEERHLFGGSTLDVFRSNGRSRTAA
jgi:DNA modification methylase